MVEKLDDDGERTLERTVGVITKCDATQIVEHVIETAENIEKPLCHGWFVVRNRTPSEVDQGVGPLERFQKERDFFNKPPWNSLPEERRGTQALKKYLAELLCTRIEQEFPTFLKTIQTNRDRTESDLQNLGVGRTTIEQKRAYLTRIAHDFNSLATQGLRGRYDGLTGNDMKLRMKIRDVNDRFVQEMNTNGHHLPFLEQTASENTRKTPLFSGFGSSAGSDSNNPFISATYQPPGGGLGLFAPPNKVRILCPRTANMPFVEYKTPGDLGIGTNVFQTIACVGDYRHFSLEELRLNDYMQAQSSSSTTEKASSHFGKSIFGTSLGTVSSADQRKQAQQSVPSPFGTSLGTVSSADQRKQAQQSVPSLFGQNSLHSEPTENI